MAIENISQLEETFGLEQGKLAEMMSSDETHTLELDKYVIKPKSDYDSYLANLKNEQMGNGVEIGRKELLKDFGIEFEGTGIHKDKEKAVEFLNNWKKTQIETAMAEAKIEPNKRYDDLKTDFEQLQGNLTQKDREFADLQNSIQREKNDRQIKQALLSEIPDNTTINKDDILAILMARNEFNIGDNGFEIIKDGQVLKNDSNLNPLTAKEFMKNAISPYLKETEGGAGGKDSSTKGGVDTMEVFMKQMADKGINQGSEAFNEALANAIAKGIVKM